MFASVPLPRAVALALALAAAAAVLAGRAAGASEATDPPPPRPAAAAGPVSAPTVEASEAWRVELDGMTTGAVRALPAADRDGTAGSEPAALFLVPVGDALEARRAADGSRAWRREGLAGSGLEAEPLPGAPATAPIAWAGMDGDGTARFALLSPANGATLASTALEEPPVGSPLTMPPREGDGPRWYVPLPRGRIAIFDGAAARIGTVEMQQEITPPLVRVAGEVIAVLGAERRAARIGALPRRNAPSHLDPATICATDRVAIAARERGVAAWRVRPLRRGTMRFGLDWEQDLGGKVSAAPLVAAPLVLVPCWDTFLYAFEMQSGHLVWRARAGHRLTTTPLRWRVFTVLQPATAPSVLFFDLVEGRPAGRIDAGEEQQFVAAPAIAGDLLVAATSRSPSRTAVLRGYALKVVSRTPGR